MKVTEYFKSMQLRPDRVGIKLEWIAKAIANPLKVEIQADGRRRCWAKMRADIYGLFSWKMVKQFTMHFLIEISRS